VKRLLMAGQWGQVSLCNTQSVDGRSASVQAGEWRHGLANLKQFRGLVDTDIEGSVLAL
jgi:hypothetical protein